MDRLLAAFDPGLNFLTLDEALSKGLLATAQEKQDDCQSELLLRSHLDQMVLMIKGKKMATTWGTKCWGASILAGPKSKDVARAVCLERIRGGCRRRMSRGGRGLVDRAISGRDAAMKHEFEQASSRREVPDGNSDAQEHLSVPGAVADMGRLRQRSVTDYMRCFYVVDRQIGIVLFIGGQLKALELVGSFSAFSEYIMSSPATTVPMRWPLRQRCQRAPLLSVD